jgi:hypothetical protein
MLSSAHVLAMDTKNLLDVCDSIRARFPDIEYNNFSNITPQPASPSFPINLPQHSSPKRQPRPPQAQQQQQQQLHFQQELYQNFETMQPMTVAPGNEQIYCNQTLPSNIGIYDNQTTIQDHSLQIVEPESNSSSQKILST